MGKRLDNRHILLSGDFGKVQRKSVDKNFRQHFHEMNEADSERSECCNIISAVISPSEFDRQISNEYKTSDGFFANRRKRTNSVEILRDRPNGNQLPTLPISERKQKKFRQ